MSDQLSFLDRAPDPRHRYFFAISVEPATGARITALGQELRRRHRLRGQPLLTERLHFTLHHLGDYDVEHNGIVDTARGAGAAVEAGCFTVELDRAMDFGGMFVLTGRDGVTELKGFQRMLGESMALAGLGKHVQKNFTPHVTLFYGENGGGEIAVEPIRWIVREFVLIHSLLGETRHTALGRWDLRG